MSRVSDMVKKLNNQISVESESGNNSKGSSVSQEGTGREIQERNKRILLEYFNVMFVKKEIDKLGNYFHKNIISHSPYWVDGVESASNAFRSFLDDSFKAELLRIGSDEDLVWMHMKLSSKLFSDLLPGNPKFVSAVGIYRLKDGKIVEHWDPMQPVPSDSPNPHVMF